MDKIKIGKLNIFDIIVIFLLIICIVFAIWKFWPKSVSTNVLEKTNKFSYVIRVEGISNTSEEMIKVGDDIYDKVSNSHIGKIVNVKAEPTKGSFETLDGKIITAEMPNKIDLELTIETDGKIANGEYIANGLIRILVGQTKEVKTKYWMATGFITKVNS